MAHTCGYCADLRLNQDNEWAPQLLGSITIQDLQAKASECHSGGCSLLLQALATCRPQMPPSTMPYHNWPNTVVMCAMDHQLQLFVTEGERHPTWPGIAHSVRHTDLTSDQSLSFVRRQLENCMKNHQSCKMPLGVQAYMPTRILDIGTCTNGDLDEFSRSSIKLVYSTDVTEDRRYVCLSHRWSTSGQTLETNGATYDAHKIGIALKDLDITYQATVHILRRLGVQYVWIDSLCIRQDCTADWLAESQTMAKVYNRALFTLAIHGESVTALNSINKPQIHLVSDPRTCPPVYTHPYIDHIWDTSESTSSSLLRRGWVYQERLLSPRVVHFNEDELSWECYEVSRCQCRERVPESDVYEKPKIEHAMALGLVDRTKPTDECAIRRRWRDMVVEYSKLDLTKLSDRLPAIRGCAEQIRGLLKDSYSFGLFERASVQDLAWYTSVKQTAARRPELFQIPAWSWGSVSGGVHFNRNKVSSGEAHVEFIQAQDDIYPGQTSAYWLVTGLMLPAQLRLAKDCTIDSGSDRDTNTDKNKTPDGIEVHVHYDHLLPAIKTTLLPTSRNTFYPDYQLCASNWDTESWYTINLIRLQQGRSASMEHDACLVLWRYGRGIPGSGIDKTTKHGHAVYQRIGLLHTDPGDNNFPEWNDPDAPLINWETAQKVTIAME